MSGVSLRAVRREDLPLLAVDHAADPIDTFGFVATNALERAFAADGLLGHDSGTLVVEDAEGAVAGKVSWLPVPHGPETDVGNVAAQRGLEKAGFQREGVARHAQFRKGSWHDMVVYSLLRGDPRP